MLSGGVRGDPFDIRYDVAVAGGLLRTAHAGTPPRRADAVVLAVHGVTSSLEVWRSVARELSADAGLALLAPDLRGRGRSSGLPGPYGMTAHMADLVDVLDDAGAEQAVLVGHSLGAYVVAGLAAEHPERVAAVVLLDGGLPIPPAPGQDLDEMLEAMVETTLGRAHLTFACPDAYAESWRTHPAFERAWDDDVDAYARYEATGAPGHVRLAVSERAVRADLADLTYQAGVLTAIERVTAPIHLLRAARGMHDEPYGMLPRSIVEDFLATQPDARVEDVPGVNHYTIALGAGPGPRAVAAAIDASVRT